MATKATPIKKATVKSAVKKVTKPKTSLTAVETALLHDLLENERVNTGALPDGLQAMLDNL